MDHCRLATFELKNGVILKGGYAGFGEPNPDARDINAYKTVLSGDMNGDDVEVNDPCDLLAETSRADNCYHVVTAIEISYYGGPNTILDGLTITGGNADGQYPDWELGLGGGMYNEESSPTLINCTFIENSARYSGGGMDNDRGWPMLIKCVFSRNFSNWGGGLANGDGRPTLIDSTFVENVSSYKGGAAANYDGSPPMNNCTFINNRAVLGGAIYGADCRPKPTNCTFTGNIAEKGGVVYNNDSSVILTNCTLIGNSAAEGGVVYDDDGGSNMINCTLTANTAITGGAMYSTYESYVRLTNCIMSGNSAESGGVIYSSDDSFVRLTNCTLGSNSADNGNALACDSYQQQNPSRIEMTNCILRDGDGEIWNNDGSEITITYSDVQGGWAGEGNIDAEPLFVEPGYWDANGVWVGGDYRLRAGSPCIDAGKDAEVYTDIEGNVRPFDFPGADNNGGLPDFDMGAYEVIARPEGEMNILPRTISRQGQRILAALRLPEPITGDDVDMHEPLVLYPGAVEATEQNLQYKPAQSEVRIHAVFDKAELLSPAPGDGDIEVTVIGRFISGQYFYCTDQVGIINSQR
jgi:predicted outer membrane repeat protein